MPNLTSWTRAIDDKWMPNITHERSKNWVIFNDPGKKLVFRVKRHSTSQLTKACIVMNGSFGSNSTFQVWHQKRKRFAKYRLDLLSLDFKFLVQSDSQAVSLNSSHWKNSRDSSHPFTSAQIKAVHMGQKQSGDQESTQNIFGSDLEVLRNNNLFDLVPRPFY